MKGSYLARPTGRVRALWRQGRGQVLLFVALGWLLSFGVRMTFPALLPNIRTDLDLSLTEAGFVLTALWIAFGVMQFPGGMLSDKLGERVVLAGSTALSMVGIGIIVVGQTWVLFLLGTVLFGFATGFFATPRITVLTNTFDEHSSTAIGITSASGNIGNVILPISAGMLAVALGWRIGFAVTLPLFILTTIALWRVIPKNVSEPRSEPLLSIDTAGRLRAGLVVRPIIIGGVALSAMAFIFQGMTGFYPTYLVIEKGFGEGLAATVFGLFFAMSIITQVLAGIGAVRFGSRLILFACAGTGIVGLASLPYVSSITQIVLLTLLLSVVSGFWPVMHTFLVRQLPAEVEGSGLGLIRTIQQVVGAAGPMMVGVLADAGLFDEAFLVLAGLGAVATGLCLRLPR